jgi:hypothetical protein
MGMDLVRPWQGPNRCGAPTGDGGPCTQFEIDGLDACFRHVPDELLAEAEEVTGWRRCRQGNGCTQVAKRGTEPPACKTHGANLGSLTSQCAAERVVEGKYADRLVLILAEHGEKFLHPDPIGNPLTELLELAAEIKSFKEALRHVASYLFSKERIRSAHDKVGEQLRAEIILYERAQERLAKILIDISKLGIEAKLAGLEDTQADTIERALTAALTATGLDLVAQQEAKVVLRRELMRVAS